MPSAFLGFATGTSWGTFTILLPIVIPVFAGVSASELTVADIGPGHDILTVSYTHLDVYKRQD